MSLVTDRLNGVVGDLFGKAPCRTVSTTNITLAGLQSFGGTTQVEGDRHLATGQTDQTENGIYIASSGTWPRAKDFDGNRDVVQGTLVSVVNGASGANLYEFTAANPITIGTTNITFSLRYGANVRYDQTTAEQSAGVTPTDYAYEPRPISDARRYGFSEANTEAQNAAAITLGALVLLNESQNGGILQLPPGLFSCDSFDIPARIMIRGAGGQATRLRNGDSGYFVKIGGAKSGVLKYKCGITDVWIELLHKDGHAIQLMETCGAEIKRIYSEGTLTGSRSNKFLTIDGGDISSFFNHIEDCIANHFELGSEIITTGGVAATQQIFNNFTVLGDVGSFPTSKGFYCNSGQGQGTVFHGGNFESCGTAVLVKSGSGVVDFFGARFEGNTLDIDIQATSNGYNFYGCTGLDAAKITSAAGGGFEWHNFWGCRNASGGLIDNLIAGNTKFQANALTDIPVLIQAKATQTSDVLKVQNSAASKMFSVNAVGDLFSNGKAGFQGTAPIAKPTVTGSRGANAAVASLLTALASYGLIIDSSS